MSAERWMESMPRRGWQWLGWLCLVICLWGLPVGLAWGAPAPAGDLTPLTPELLQDRLGHLVNRDGRPTIDLRRTLIDLRSESALGDRFYRLLQTRLRSGSNPIALDLSYAVVQGDLDLQKLGLRAPLYGDALFPLLDEAAQAQLKRDRKRLSQLSQLSRSLLIQGEAAAQQIYLIRGPLIWVQTRFTGQVTGTDVFFLGQILAQGAQFDQPVYLSGSRFNRSANFAGARFRQSLQLRNSIFFQKLRFNQCRFEGPLSLQGAEVKGEANFNQSLFLGESNLSRVLWEGNADFAQTTWKETATLLKSVFLKALFLTEARFDAPLILRQARFHDPINLRNAVLNSQVDLGDATFLRAAYINVSGLEFNADQAEILGSPGTIGKRFSVPTLAGNETLMRNLERNFRRLEQIADANQIQYTAERQRLKDWQQQLLGVNINTATEAQLVQVGFSPQQAAAIVQQRADQPFLSASDLLSVEGIDLAAYVKVRDRILTRRPLSGVNRLSLMLAWIWLDGLIVLSNYGTSFGLCFCSGLLVIAYFALMFWFIDRYRRRLPTPILPPREESLWMLGSALLLLVVGLSGIFRIADYPRLTLLWLTVLCLPVPGLLVGRLLQQGRFHDLMDESYLVEDGSMRQLRLLIARLPIIPKFPFFRERFTPILLDRRWNWLNYYDFSLNNWLRFGFNDIRLRDQHMPGLITALVWYQWGLGLLYVALVLWTLSRTIPGLNLLIYF